LGTSIVLPSSIIVFFLIFLTGASAQESKQILSEYCEFRKSVDPYYECASIPKPTKSTEDAKQYLSENIQTFTEEDRQRALELQAKIETEQNKITQNPTQVQNPTNNSSQMIIDYAAGIILLIIIIVIIAVVVSRRKRSSATYKPIVYSHDSSSRKDSKVALGSGRDNERKKARNIKRAISNSAKNSADFKKESSDSRKRYGQRRKRKK